MTDNEMLWEDPPTPTFGERGKWERRLVPLIEHPERWAMIHEGSNTGNASTLANRFRSRKMRIPNPDDCWEFVTRGSKVYARYMGPPQ